MMRDATGSSSSTVSTLTKAVTSRHADGIE
jgi:hypothetical protein